MKATKIIVKKIKSEYFIDVITGTKTFELRKEDDVRYEVGDTLILNEIDNNKNLTNRSATYIITYVLRDYEGLEKGYVILGIKPLGEANEEERKDFVDWLNSYDRWKGGNK